MKKWLQKSIDRLMALLKEGTTPTKLGWSVATGIGIGLSPLIGTSTILCVVVGFIFRLNHPAIQISHLILSPFQFPLLFFFIYAGEKVFNQPHIVPKIIQEVRTGAFSPFATLETYWTSFWQAGVVWLIVAIPAVIVLGLILSNVFTRAQKKMEIVQ